MIFVGDALSLPLPDESVDAICTDPPFGWSFMGRGWDSDVPGPEFWREAMRVAKPGAHMIAWTGPRTSHHLAHAIEEAGWEIRDKLMHLFGSGFPKSHDVSKAIDREAGAEREDLGPSPTWREAKRDNGQSMNPMRNESRITAPATEAAKQWAGFGTALKPAYEEGWLCRKPLSGTVAQNVQRYGTGALNIDGTRIGTHEYSPDEWSAKGLARVTGNAYGKHGPSDTPLPSGRWPANLILDEHAAGLVDAASGERAPGGNVNAGTGRPMFQGSGVAADFVSHGDCGGASRFFYVAKASRAEREAGLVGFAGIDQLGYEGGPLNRPDHASSDGSKRTGDREPLRNHHPCVKPISLLRWLVRLVTPPNGLILDPFMGSGTTGCAAALEGFRFVGLDREREYVEIARARIDYWRRMGDQPLSHVETYTSEDPAQQSLFSTNGGHR